MNDTNEVLNTLKAIHTAQLAQGRHLRTIYGIVVILFTLFVLAVGAAGVEWLMHTPIGEKIISGH